MDLELAGKTAIVTGGSRGIGKAIARELASEGVDVAIAARGREALDEAAAELGRIHVLVNCAARPLGSAPIPSLAEITDDHFWADMNVKVMGYLRCAREVAPHMRRQGWGRIVNVSGLASRMTGSAIGSMRNVAVSAMTKNLADELGPHGINVTVVNPGYTYTERTPGMIEARASAEGVSPEEVERRMAEANSVRRFIDARDVAHVVAFLASPKSVAINGDVIAAGGGVGNAIYY